jgi:hypothetical protein
MKKMMLDLCAGFGGQSEAFLRAGWDVLRIDNNPLLSEVPNVVIMNIEDAKPFNLCGHPIDYVHASPPCYEFSTAYDAPRSKAYREGVTDYQPDLTLVKECMRIIRDLKPRYWSLENVRGSIKYLKPILGEPRLIVGSYVYWGNFPLFDPSTLTIPTKMSKDRRWSPLRSNYFAKIDLCVSEAFLNAMESQQTLVEFTTARQRSPNPN